MFRTLSRVHWASDQTLVRRQTCGLGQWPGPAAWIIEAARTGRRDADWAALTHAAWAIGGLGRRPGPAALSRRGLRGAVVRDCRPVLRRMLRTAKPCITTPYACAGAALTIIPLQRLAELALLQAETVKVYARAHTHMRAHMCICVCVCVCARARAYVCPCICARERFLACARACWRACVPSYVCARVHLHAYVHACARTCVCSSTLNSGSWRR